MQRRRVQQQRQWRRRVCAAGVGLLLQHSRYRGEAGIISFIHALLAACKPAALAPCLDLVYVTSVPTSAPSTHCNPSRPQLNPLHAWLLQAGVALRTRALHRPYGDQALFVRRRCLEQLQVSKGRMH